MVGASNFHPFKCRIFHEIYKPSSDWLWKPLEARKNSRPAVTFVQGGDSGTMPASFGQRFCATKKTPSLKGATMVPWCHGQTKQIRYWGFRGISICHVGTP